MARFLVPQRSRIVRWRGTLEGLLPSDHLARFTWRILSSIDFSEIEATYRALDGGPGRSPFHPRVLAALWVYGMTQGMEEATVIAQACRLRDDFRWLAGGLCPSDQTLLNFLTRAQANVEAIWEQMLRAMHAAGHVDLSAVAEDGTKLRANASRASFHAADEIEAVIKRLRSELETRLTQANAIPSPKDAGAIAGLRRRLSRAEQAAEELRARALRRAAKRPAATAPSPLMPSAPSHTSPLMPSAPSHTPRQFQLRDFRRDAERDMMICPADRELHVIGKYPKDRARYVLYGRSDCSGCDLKARCTDAKGRRLKVSLESQDSTAQMPATASESPSVVDSTTVAERTDGVENDSRASSASESSGPQASITEPEALLMLATSEKRWEPSYNADITVTRHGVIISQFLTKRPTDYHSFEPALAGVCATLKPPESWIGDGHYGTQANLVAAAKAGVLLYAGSAREAATAHAELSTDGIPATVDSPTLPATTTDDMMKAGAIDAAKSSTGVFRGIDFRLDAERDVLVCPAGEELLFLGAYPTENRRRLYRLYARRDCGGCSLKDRCTDAKGRRVKILDALTEVPTDTTAQNVDCEPSNSNPTSDQNLEVLIRAHEARMKDVGPNVMRFRGQTVEPVNAQLKQHGLGRLHVHGLARSGVVLTLACMGHNVMKWRAREAAHVVNLAA